VTERAAIEAALVLARPRVIAALLRAFRDLDTAEDGFQEASLRALERWAEKGAPGDPAAWLVLVGRNAIFDVKRRSKRHTELEEIPDEPLPDEGDSETSLVSRLDDADYEDDVLRLLFVCCHPELPPAQQIALALRVVCGLSVKEIARAFLVSESALEQRITRAKTRIGEAQVPFDAPGPVERAERVAAVAAMVYLVFNEGYSATGGEAHIRAPLCDEAIRLSRLLLGLFPDEPSILGLTALLLLQHARTAARLDGEGNIVLLDRQDRSRWDRSMIDEGVALIDAGMRLGRADPYLVQAAIAALHAQARRAEDTDWAQIDLLYATLEELRPSPVVTLNRAVAVARTRGAAAALALIAPLESRLGDYFHFHGVKGALLAELGRRDEARRALERALELAKTLAEAAQIRLRLEEVR
jgi:RNA polymerase sigma-70 factor (ECF subfamily)